MHTDVEKRPKQTKITLALDAYPDVKAMVGKYYERFPDDGPTDFGIPALREYFIKHGYGRKPVVHRKRGAVR